MLNKYGWNEQLNTATRLKAVFTISYCLRKQGVEFSFVLLIFPRFSSSAVQSDATNTGRSNSGTAESWEKGSKRSVAHCLPTQ